jgi:quinol monooxygenase YgiN
MTPLIPEGIVGRRAPVALYGFANARPGRGGELERLLLSFVAPTRAEPGCWQYQVHRDGTGQLVFYELWQSGDDLASHLQEPMMADFLEHRMDYLATDLEIQWLEPLDPGPDPIQRS